MAEVQWNPKELEARVLNAAVAIVRDVTLGIERDAILSVQNEYPPASKPGHPPHKRKGILTSNIGPAEFEDGGLLGRTGTGYMVGRWLELGTSKMAPRPFLRPAFNKNTKDVKGIITRHNL